MPVFEMPLEKLKVYQGTNPRPDDFDAYWDAGLAEMHALDPAVELRPAAFTCPFADCFDLYYTGVRNARIHAKYVRPKKLSGPIPAVVKFHGYGGSAGEWFDLLPFAAAGLAAAAMDCRGQFGASTFTNGVVSHYYRGHIISGLEDPDPANLTFRHVFLDAAQLAGLLMDRPEVDAGRVGVFGGSQGGGLTLACAALEPRVKKLVSLFPFLSDYRRAWDMDLATGAYEEIKSFFRYYDPNHKRENDIFTRLGYIDVQHLAPRIQGQTLMVTALMDTICPPSTQFAAYNKINAPKDMIFYPDFAHEFLPGMSDRILSVMTTL
ncbi:MAG: alpha/beta fold hydrolase [Sedimentisphaerales bacterium]|nr:alpha/beta fold hydrolase [Sedimentisphaerales bacterium]